ncbi:MAG: hypothetical protein JXR19_06460 [Bacteroidia bacterium]
MRLFSILVLYLACSANAQTLKRSLITTPSNANETSVAINPANTDEMYAACNVDRFFTYQPEDNLWNESVARSRYGVYGDPVLHFSRGHLFYAHLSKTKGKKYGDWFDRIVVQKIVNAELWEEQSYSVGYNNGKMQDKPWLSSDEHSTQYKGNVYISWTEFDVYASHNPEDRSRIRFSYFNPDMDSFSTAITISDITGNCVDGDSTLEGAVTAVGPNGEIYAVWAGNNKIFFDKSLDGGKTWGEDKIIGEQVNGWNMEMPNIMRANGMPFIVSDTIENTIYVCWADTRNGKADIWAKHSTNQGEGWSDAFQMDHNSKSHSYFPNMVYNPKEGGINVFYFDQSRSPNEKYYDVMMSKFSPIHGYTEPVIVNYKPIALPGQRFFYGDYIDLDYQEETQLFCYPVYRGLHSSLAMVIVEGGWSPIYGRHHEQMHLQHLEDAVDVTANKEALYLSCYSSNFKKLKGKLTYWQDGEKRKIKFKYSPEDNGLKEHELAMAKLDPNLDLYVSLKYRYKRLSDGKKIKLQVSHSYP